jgi:hypothetical protein
MSRVRKNFTGSYDAQRCRDHPKAKKIRGLYDLAFAPQILLAGIRSCEMNAGSAIINCVHFGELDRTCCFRHGTFSSG